MGGTFLDAGIADRTQMAVLTNLPLQVGHNKCTVPLTSHAASRYPSSIQSQTLFYI